MNADTAVLLQVALMILTGIATIACGVVYVITDGEHGGIIGFGLGWLTLIIGGSLYDSSQEALKGAAVMAVLPAGKPRLIRQVTKRMKRKTDGAKATGAPKAARDKRLHLVMEKVKAAALHECASPFCFHEQRLIRKGMFYAALSDQSPGAPQGPFIKGRRLPGPPVKYHPDCVPPAASPLVRLLWPARWKAETCVSRDREVDGAWDVRYFTSETTWRMWLRHRHPAMMQHGNFAKEWANGTMLQHGTGYHWSVLTKV